MFVCVCVVQTRRSSQSEAVALQAIRNAKGNSLCVDCEAPSEFLMSASSPSSRWFPLEDYSAFLHHPLPVVLSHLTVCFDSVICVIYWPRAPFCLALQIQHGPVWTWVRWSALSARGSIEIWGLTCLACARWTWTTCPESSRKSWLPSETTWPTASGRAAPRAEPNPHPMQPGGFRSSQDI